MSTHAANSMPLPGQRVNEQQQQTATSATKTQPPRRVLACVQCQQRKVKCDRKFPCENCVRAGAQCVPAALVSRPRRRRFPERELLDRVRHYEDLLRQNNVQFEPLHAPAAAAAENAAPSEDGRGPDSVDGVQSKREKTAVKTEAVDLLQAISVMTLDSDEDKDQGEVDHDDYDSDSAFQHAHVHDAFTKDAWDQYYSEGNGHLLFGAPNANIILSTLHPEQVQIFRLWQIYLENINPLLKVTHTPTLQARIIDAVSDMANINPVLQALIFGIYCVSVMSLTEDECRALFGSPRKDLLARYQFACRQALLNCKALWIRNGDSLTALYLYLVSRRSQADPRSLSSTLAVAIRLAQRMGMHNESTYTKCTLLEAEMRRRLWWSLVVFDHRICEMSGYHTTTLVPTWDCKAPLNVNDFEILPGMKASPPIHDNLTEALFVVVRSELADYVRHSSFHLNFVNPLLNTIAQAKYNQCGIVPEGGELATLEKVIEEKYVAFCDAGNPLHIMTMWTTRGQLARYRLLEYYSTHSVSVQQTDAQRHAAFSDALSIIECETKIRTSPLAKGFLWFVDFHSPALAYFHVLRALRKRPTEKHAERAWDVMSDNHEASAAQHRPDEPSIFDLFAQILSKAWEAREAILRQQDKSPEEPPRIIRSIRNKMVQLSSNFPQRGYGEQQINDSAGISIDESLMPTSMNFGGHGTGEQGFAGMGHGGFSEIPTQGIMDVDIDPFWAAVDWRPMHTKEW